jgi:hypothetical protein
VATGRRVGRKGAVGSVRWARGAHGLRQAEGGFASAAHGQPQPTQPATCQRLAAPAWLVSLLCLLVATKAKESRDGLCCAAAVMAYARLFSPFLGGLNVNLTAWSLTGQVCSPGHSHMFTTSWCCIIRI